MHAINYIPRRGTPKSDINPDYIEIDCRHWLQQPASAITNGAEQ